MKPTASFSALAGSGRLKTATRTSLPARSLRHVLPLRFFHRSTLGHRPTTVRNPRSPPPPPPPFFVLFSSPLVQSPSSNLLPSPPLSLSSTFLSSPVSIRQSTIRRNRTLGFRSNSFHIQTNHRCEIFALASQEQLIQRCATLGSTLPVTGLVIVSLQRRKDWFQGSQWRKGSVICDRSGYRILDSFLR